ncbi:MAG TPA: ribokinase [Mycobacteriales bacterium]|nr:ribokinase [Mycobacteriales bacterium]
MSRIAVFGSINMDLVAVAERAPGRGETVSGERFFTAPGGKGANQAIAAARAGAEVSMIGAVGTDDFGGQLRETLRTAGVRIDTIRTEPGPSGIAHIVVESAGHNSIIVVPGANGTLTEVGSADAERIVAADLLLLQLEIPLPGVLAAAKVARENGTRVVLTPAPAVPLPVELLECVDLLVPNQHEAATITGETDPDGALAELVKRVPEIVLTLGADGCRYRARNGENLCVPGFSVPSVDTTAAGDCFTGALSVAIGEGKPMAEALRWGSAAAAVSVQRPGASSSMPTRTEIDEFSASMN